MQRPANTKLNQQGFASIVVALVLIIVLALLTVGFAQLARREQQTALDKQKATQATYAAESGINSAYKDILSGKITTSNASATNCMKAGSGPSNLPNDALTAKQVIDANNGVSYSCLLIQLNTDNLQFDNLLPNTSRHMTFGTTDPLSSLTVRWGSATGRSGFTSSVNTNSPTLPVNANWSYLPVVEISLTPIDGVAGQSNPVQYLVDNSFTFYVYPSRNGTNSLNFDPAHTGQVIAGACSSSDRTYPCSVTLNNLSGQNYVVRITDYYDASNVMVTGKAASGTATKFSGEPVIDVTGKSRDVLKRLRARILINGANNSMPDDNAILPIGAIEAQNICKRIQAGPATTDFPQGSSYDTNTSSSCDLSQN